MASENRKANLFVVGAMRAGTTSFMELLAQHPEIYTSPIKEPHYFSETLPETIFEPQSSSVLAEYFKKEFPRPIHRAHVKKLTDYHKLFGKATSEKYRAEGSVSYLHEPNAASKIKHYNPDAKIIVLVRDPLKRAKSHYQMNKGLFREKRSFEAVMKAEIEAYQNGRLPWYSTLGMSFYKAPILNYKKHFEDNVLVIALEDLVSNTKKITTEISTFLNIGSFETNSLSKLNNNKSLRFKKVVGVLHYLKLKRVLFSRPPSSGKIWAKGFFLSDKKGIITISDELRKVLIAIFQKEC